MGSRLKKPGRPRRDTLNSLSFSLSSTARHQPNEKDPGSSSESTSAGASVPRRTHAPTQSQNNVTRRSSNTQLSEGSSPSVSPQPPSRPTKKRLISKAEMRFLERSRLDSNEKDHVESRGRVSARNSSVSEPSASSISPSRKPTQSRGSLSRQSLSSKRPSIPRQPTSNSRRGSHSRTRSPSQSENSTSRKGSRSALERELAGVNTFNENYPVGKEPLPEKRKTRNNNPINFLRPEMAVLIDITDDSEEGLPTARAGPRTMRKRKASEIARNRWLGASDVNSIETENNEGKLDMQYYVYSTYNSSDLDTDEPSSKRPRKLNKHDDKDLLIGHHIDDEKLPGRSPICNTERKVTKAVFARYYPNGQVVTRAYSGDIEAEVYQRWRSLFSVENKGLVQPDKIKYDALVFGKDPDMQSLSLGEQNKRIQEVLDEKKGRFIGNHKAHADLPVFAGYSGSSKQGRGSFFTRIYRDDITKEMQDELPDLIRNYNKGMITLDQIQFNPCLRVNENEDLQTLSDAEKRQRISDFIASPPGVPPSQQDASDISYSTAATGEEIVVNRSGRQDEVDGRPDISDHDDKILRDQHNQSKQHHMRKVHVGSWARDSRVPVHAYMSADETIMFRCYEDQFPREIKGAYHDFKKFKEQVKMDAIVFKKDFSHATTEGTNKLICLALKKLGDSIEDSNSRSNPKHSMTAKCQYDVACEGADEEEDVAKEEQHDTVWSELDRTDRLHSVRKTLLDSSPQAITGVVDAIHHYERATKVHVDNLESIIQRKDGEIANQNTKIEQYASTIAELQAKIDRLEKGKHWGKSGTVRHGNKTYQLNKTGSLAGMYTKESTIHVDGQKYNEWRVMSPAPQVDIGPASTYRILQNGIPFRRIAVGPNEGKLIEQFVDTRGVSLIDGTFVILTRIRERADERGVA
ncbi:hypothetical protein BP5796_08159 [Coleophoma crateriformis]|uniref:Uncharacterized protein n=1 Tax=Coleophoma crateriformis TaxID=565419 RepID=A0A3D8RDL2_9HELO|nr:hypothetical protein BP5796_08159 [Coleophoma crateriformis]